MLNYVIYVCDSNEDEIIVEILNISDILIVQKMIIEKGYVIDKMIGDYYFKAYKFREDAYYD